MELDANPGEIASVEIVESRIDHNVDNSFVSDKIDNDDHCHDSLFYNSLSTRAEMAKMMGSIRSVTVNDVPCAIFTTPVSGNFEDLT